MRNKILILLGVLVLVYLFYPLNRFASPGTPVSKFKNNFQNIKYNLARLIEGPKPK